MKLPIKEKEKHMISNQTRADICSLLIGFDELCSELRNNSCSIVPNRINSDVIENVFCQQRGLYNGNNTNPTYLNYCRTINDLGQATISRKSNAGGITHGHWQFNPPSYLLITTGTCGQDPMLLPFF